MTHTDKKSIDTQPILLGYAFFLILNGEFIDLLQTVWTYHRVNNTVFVINVLLVEDIFF